MIKEVLGPREGINEILDESPVSEYICGVLAPIVEKEREPSDIDDDAQIPSDDAQTYEEETDDIDVNTPPLLYPALDPKSKPSTMGLSFVIQSQETPKVDVCLTWAKYEEFTAGEKETVKRRWKRRPLFSILQPEMKSAIYWFDGQGEQTDDPAKAEISFHIIVNNEEESRYFIQLYIVNRIRPKSKMIMPEHHIFQPQIRAVCGNGAILVSGIRKTPKGEEERELEFLYRKRPFYARGHLCSAIWNEIDPEKSPSSKISIDFDECLHDAPFTWLDGEIVPDLQRKRFSPPDVRTEFVPMYSIPYPELDMPDDYQQKPVLSAFELSEKWSNEDLTNALVPLVQGYDAWINSLEEEVSSLNSSQSILAKENIRDCKVVRDRIKSGIDILCRDSEAKLAFCFSNKAVDTQWRWTKNSDFMWRPFQLAFILMTLESVVNKHSAYRDTCDLLWVPTGAGKTEAYSSNRCFYSLLQKKKISEKRNL